MTTGGAMRKTSKNSKQVVYVVEWRAVSETQFSYRLDQIYGSLASATKYVDKICSKKAEGYNWVIYRIRPLIVRK